jgi:hypothetical protein
MNISPTISPQIESKDNQMEISIESPKIQPTKTIINDLQQLLKNPKSDGGIVEMFKTLLATAAAQQDISTTPSTSTATTSTEAASSIIEPPPTTTPQPLMSTKPMPLMQAEIQPTPKLLSKEQPPNLMCLDLQPQTTKTTNSTYASYVPPIRPRDKHEQEDSLLVIDGRSYRIQPDQRCIIKIYYHDHELYCDTRTKDVYIDSKRVYRMGDTTKEVMLNGRRVRLMYMGKRIELWIDGVSFHFRADSPPKQISITSQLTGFSKRFHVTIEGRTMDMFFNHYKVCNLTNGLRNRELVQTVKLAADDFETHEIAYMCPPKRIMIDDQPRIMRYDLPIPCVEIDGQFYVIRFSGQSRNIMIDDMIYEVPFEGVKRIRLNNRAHELAWGGPGFEVIIDGRPYELQFGQSQPREVFIGARQHYIRVLGDPPDVKICGRVPDDILKEHLEQLREEEEKKSQKQKIIPPSVGTQQQPATNLNVTDLLDKLKEYNLLPLKKEVSEQPSYVQQKVYADITSVGQPPALSQAPEEQIPDLTSLDHGLLKKKYNQAIQNLYGGTQCATCGMRFTSEQSKRFSNHYDWHFRQNKREKEEINTAHTRGWYYDVPEWIEYEELSEEVQAQQGQLQQQIDGDTRTSTAQLNEIVSSYSSNNQNPSNDNDHDLNNTSIQHNTTLKTSICPATSDIDDVSGVYF